uniref:Uncharacterized protein n=1 Tax=Timema monikensis TaxID=170555 RepID=A0A7R9HPX7_9NEOP|nr:unnamed protein product [Timema monikensis]
MVFLAASTSKRSAANTSSYATAFFLMRRSNGHTPRATLNASVATVRYLTAPHDQPGLDTSDISYAFSLPLLEDSAVCHSMAYYQPWYHLSPQSPRQLFGLHVDIVALCHWTGQYQFSPQLLPVSFAHVVSPSFPFPISIHQPPRDKFKDDQVMVTDRDVVHNPPTFHHVHGLGVTQSDVNVGRSPSSPLICRGIIRLVCNLKPMTIDELLQSTTPSISPNHPMTMPHGRLSISISVTTNRSSIRGRRPWTAYAAILPSFSSQLNLSPLVTEPFTKYCKRCTLEVERPIVT